MAETAGAELVKQVADKVEGLQLRDEERETVQEPVAAAADADVEGASDVSPTVFSSTDDFTVVHPLTHKWALWYTKPQTSPNEDWHSLLKRVVEISTVEEFWGAYNNIPKVGELPNKADYSFFKDEIRPEWEDQHNSKGGKWQYQFKARKIPLDDVWLRVLLGLIGGTLDSDDEQINGACLNVRRGGIRVTIWTRGTDVDKLRGVGQRFKNLLGLSDRDEIEFAPHNENVKGKHKITL
jgi:translation initiation factor 4E